MMDYSSFANDSGLTQQVPLELIDPDPNQPRKIFDRDELEQLKASILEFDLLEPIGVYREGKRYRILYGERRYRACGELGFKTIEARIVEKPPIPLLVQLNENCSRKDLTPGETLQSIENLVTEHKVSIKQIASSVSLSERQVRRYLSISANPELREQLLAGTSMRDVLEELERSPSPAASNQADSVTPDTEKVDESSGASAMEGLPGSVEPVTPEAPEPANRGSHEDAPSLPEGMTEKVKPSSQPSGDAGTFVGGGVDAIGGTIFTEVLSWARGIADAWPSLTPAEREQLLSILSSLNTERKNDE